ncbi:MAG: 4-hydroxythreonine-4-phosphate dehydrogenase [Candidatus Saganbacteria bacterium]|uniref:4-hydroxythreonine-4-phosphate dehydrogenase n=1 Tax=Candidatus Saganbacteria bacterium TaxID=2575572 RepID=A0A833L4A4_UNCSA|nr:MAG: 4-hydroxythreonine-4-phosphate dehydrogenase [Candidatus Saganbacteria bacterium]
MRKPIIGLTMGDPAGIGSEVCVKALADPQISHIANCLIIGETNSIKYALKISKLPEIKINPIKKVSDAKFISGTIDVIDLENIKKVKMGRLSSACGKASIEYVEKAIDLAIEKKIDAIVTAPINKEAIQKAGFKYQGHTEILAERTKTKDFGMMFVADKFWLMLATTHIALKDVSQALDKKKILEKIKLAHKTMLKIRGKKPKIAVAGINPHAGEGGIFGREEIKFIEPAVEEAKKLGIDVKGPISPDAVFNLANSGKFDIVIAMYHDQGLIPLKLLSFNKSVNVTVGLPIIRTSVDHGTGFDIAGKGKASPDSMICAIKTAVKFARA